jgi:chorismate synthase
MIPQFGGTTKTNLSGGIRGGISNGMDISKCCFKPVATIMQKQESLDNQGNITEMTGKDVMIHVWSREQCLSLKQWLRLYDFYLINKIY